MTWAASRVPGRSQSMLHEMLWGRLPRWWPCRGPRPPSTLLALGRGVLCGCHLTFQGPLGLPKCRSLGLGRRDRQVLPARGAQREAVGCPSAGLEHPTSAEPTLPEGSVPGARPTRWPDCGARVGGPGSCCSLHRGPGWPQGLVQVREVSLGPAHLMGDSGPALAPVPLTPRPLSHSWAIPGGAVAVATPTDGTRTGAAAPAVHG